MDSRPARRIVKSHIWYSTCVPELRVLDCCITCICFHVITVTSDGPVTQHQGLRGHIPCILVGTTRASQECGQFLEKPWYTVNRVPLTKNNLQAPFVARNYLVEYFHGKYWPVSGVKMHERRMARVESRERITSGRESKKKAICQLQNGVSIFTVSVFNLLSSSTSS